MIAENQTLKSLRQRWAAVLLFSIILPSLALAFFTGIICRYFQQSPLWALPVLLVVFAGLILTCKPWKLNDAEVARILDSHLPENEESTALLLKPGTERTLLEKLQSARIEQHISKSPLPLSLRKRVWAAVLFSAILLVPGLLFFRGNYPLKQTPVKTFFDPLTLPPEKILPAITSVSVLITPPAYTGKAQRTQSRFGLRAEKKSRVKWTIETNTDIRPVLIFDGKKQLNGRAEITGKNRWTFDRAIEENGFYQVRIGQKKSELYPVEVIPDRPPAIRIGKPQPYSTIDVGQPQQSLFQVQISDDYGLAASVLSTTVASGKGEAVKFKEVKTALPGVSGKRTAAITRVFDLKQMGMQPGDELYFYVTATDNNRQQSRSDVYIVSIADTAELMSMNGLVSGVNLVPEYFRSQRQIIIETEQLIKGRDTLGTAKFNAKSNDLGFDQKVLRLRYGKFLGEENESGGAHEHDEDEHAEPKAFGDAQAIIEPYTHKHDNAEDATFFEPQQKKQLKDVLAEMWKAELRLRTYKPQEALPFEYKALRLLKDLQQSQRAYVAKTAYTPPPIKPDKRLSGELDKIGQPSVSRKKEADSGRENSLRSAAAVVGSLQKNTLLSPAQQQLLQNASAEIRKQASLKPGAFLPAVSAMQDLLNGSRKPADIKIVQSALQRIVPPPARLPQPQSSGPGSLSARYFQQLNRQQK